MGVKIENARGTICARSSLLRSTTMPTGPSAKPAKVVEVELVLNVEASDHLKGLEALFPGAHRYAQEVAGLEDCKGEDRTSRTKLGDVTVTLRGDGDDDGPVLDKVLATVKSRPQLKVDDQGEATLVLRPRVKLSGKQLAQVCELIGADVRVSVEPAQLDLLAGAPEPPKTEEPVGKGRAKKGGGSVVVLRKKKAAEEDPFAVDGKTAAAGE